MLDKIYSKELTDIFNDTYNLVINGKYNSTLQSAKLNSSWGSINKTTRTTRYLKKGNLTVDNNDCILITQNLSKVGKTCLLNMASFKRPGGGVKRGAMSQEEEICRRSNLMFGLNEKEYPLSINDFIYTKDVAFFKDKNYEICDQFESDVITIAAIDLKMGKPDDYMKIMTEKISTMLVYPYIQGCTNLVLSAFGCGVFKNDPNIVSNIFSKILIDKSYKNLYDNVSFAILNDHNSVNDNYNIFKNTLIGK